MLAEGSGTFRNKPKTRYIIATKAKEILIRTAKFLSFRNHMARKTYSRVEK
jgi:hypothetical protein